MEIKRLRSGLLSPQSTPGPSRLSRVSVSCTRCGGCFDRDPTLLVDCPVCGAGQGAACLKPILGGIRASHLMRGRVALQQRRMSPCPALTWDDLHNFAIPVPVPTADRPAPGRLRRNPLA